MPFIPHTDADIREMLGVIGADSIDDLFDEIPDFAGRVPLPRVADGVSEMAMLHRMQTLAERNDALVCFAGAGCYDHHIPSAVWDLTSRGEFMTAYTPYQAEASQGTLQLIYEYQSMMTRLTAMEVANASVYDGGSGLAEAVLMAIRGNRKNTSRRVLTAQTVHPHYRQAAAAIVRNQGVEIVDVACPSGGLSTDDLPDGELAALVIQQPGFYGTLDDVDQLTDWAHERNALVIAVVNPMALAVLKPPGQWGRDGADIACGDGQPFGIPMSAGGPSFGFMCARQSLVRQMPGRIIGRTEDLDGRTGYALTLQAREQHIRRGKATSNICTNQGLLVTAGTIYLSLLGPEGLQAVARASHRNTRRLVSQACALDGVSQRYSAPFFHECVLELPRASDDVVAALAQRGYLGGVALAGYAPDHANSLLVCATEKRTAEEIDGFCAALEEVLS